MSERLFSMPVVGTDRDHALARATDPDTSHRADAELRKREGPAWGIKPGTHRHRALECFVRNEALIAEDVKFITGVDGIWKRVSDLKNMGLIQGTGKTASSPSGRQAELYEITDEGRAAYALLGPT